MKKEKVAFVTHCSDDWFYPGGCEKLIRTKNYWHPEIPMFVFGSLELNVIANKHRNVSWLNLNPLVSSRLADKYDLVVHFDADSIITGKLDKLLEADYEVAGVRNNNDRDHASRERDDPITINGCKPEEYMNAGLVASRNPEFWEDWKAFNYSAPYTNYKYGEQDTYNIILQDNKYDFLCLDSKTDDCYYGIASLSGIDSHWESLKYVSLVANNLMLNNKFVKVVHEAGGGKPPKLDFDKLFDEEVSKYLSTIVLHGDTRYQKIIVEK